MDIIKFKEWRESDDYQKALNVNSNVILYKNDYTNKDSWEWGIWGNRDIPDDWLAQNQKEYPELDIKRMKVSIIR